ncbi:hypothetical protein J4442_00420 [Candidatus Woesearchaeota archaeon]|nr:hypothetical protein [Candidatus Woesearchaeota archaeon]
MEDIEKEVKEKLKNYVNQDIVFLKKNGKNGLKKENGICLKRKQGLMFRLFIIY